jgi:hypothetical protein
MAAKSRNDGSLADVFVTQQESEAMVVHGLLESAGIDSAVISGEAQDVLAGVGSLVIRVTPEHAEEARGLIEEYKNASVSEDEDVEDWELSAEGTQPGD